MFVRFFGKNKNVTIRSVNTAQRCLYFDEFFLRWVICRAAIGSNDLQGFVRLSDTELGQPSVQALEQYTSFADLLTRDETASAAVSSLRHLHASLYL